MPESVHRATLYVSCSWSEYTGSMYTGDKNTVNKVNCGVKGRVERAEELDIETGEGQTTVGRTRRKDGG